MESLSSVFLQLSTKIQLAFLQICEIVTFGQGKTFVKIEIASNREISARLKNAITEDILYKDLAALVDVDGTTVKRWENDANSGGVREVAVIAANLGLTPNQLLLKSQLSNHLETFEAVLSDQQLLEYIPLTTQLAELSRLCSGADESPIALLTDFIRSMNGQLKLIPSGVVIRSDGNVKTYERPYGSGGGIAEDVPPYGKKSAAPNPDDLRHAAAILRDEASKKDPNSAEFLALHRAFETLKALIDLQGGGSFQEKPKGPTAPKPTNEKPHGGPGAHHRKNS